MNPPPSLGLAQRAHSGWVVLGQERTHTSWIDEPLATYPRYLSKYLCWVRTCPGTVGQVCPTVHPVVLYLAGAWSTQPRARYPSSSPKHELRLEEKGNPSGHAGPVTPSAQLQLSTSHQFAQPFWGQYLHPAFVLSCLVLSFQFLVASKLVLLPMSTRGNGGPHRPPLPLPYPCGLWLLCAVLCCVCWRSSSSPLPNLLCSSGPLTRGLSSSLVSLGSLALPMYHNQHRLD